MARHRMVVLTPDYTPGCDGRSITEGVRVRRRGDSVTLQRPQRSCAARRSVALALLVSVLAICTLRPAAAQQVPVFRTGIDPVTIGVTVTDKKGNLITDLTAGDFDVLEDGKKQTVTYFAAGDHPGPSQAEMHLGLLLDVSESMGDDIGFT